MRTTKECPQEYGLHSAMITGKYYGSCNKCNDQLQRYDSGYNSSGVLNETTPLVQHAPDKQFINARVFSLGLLFIGGIAIGCYLLYEQSRPDAINSIFELVSRESWGATELLTRQKLNPSNVEHILVYHTATPECFSPDECIQAVRSLQNETFEHEKHDIPFNYLIGGDGRTYEARGWSNESESPVRNDIVLSVAFIGNFTSVNPPMEQLKAGLALISELEFQKRIAQNYDILGIRNYRRAHNDGAALFASVSQWKRWDGVLSIY